MPKYAKRVDGNHDQIRDTLRSIPGFVVEDTSKMGDGFPDLVVAGMHQSWHIPYVVLVELKTTRGKLNTKQKEFHARWQGYPIYVVVNVSTLLIDAFAWEETQARSLDRIDSAQETMER